MMMRKKKKTKKLILDGWMHACMHLENVPCAPRLARVDMTKTFFQENSVVLESIQILGTAEDDVAKTKTEARVQSSSR